MTSEVVVGDLVQFAQTATSLRKCWKALPVSGQDFKAFSTLPFVLSFLEPQEDWPHLPQNTPWSIPTKETVKFPMTVLEIVTHCYANSKLAAIKIAQTKQFAKILLVVDRGGHPEQHTLWTLLSDLEVYTGVSYMDDLKLKLKDKLSKQKMSDSEK
jgi:hypothetical protein